jgi:hydrogenase 3 maturation protease
LAELERLHVKALSTYADWQPPLREILASASQTTRIALVGVGHPMRCDDYVGSFIVKTLKDGARVRGVILFDVEDHFEFMVSKIIASNPKHLILIDACEMNASAGEVALIPIAKTQFPFFTTHGVPLKLLVSKFLPNVETWVLAIQPERMEFNDALSPAVLAAANSVSKFIASELKETQSNA